jgi:beta-lactam-binding protein with PASTA domain
MSQHWFRDFIIAVLTHRFVKLVGSIVALFLAFGLMLDWVIMPIYTKHGEAVEVPNVVSMRYEEAKSTLEAEGFEVIRSTEQRFDEKSPVGYVLEQIPRPHAGVKSGRRIYLVVSQGGRLVQMPQLVERSQRDAQLMLRKFNLTLGRVDSAFTDKPSGVVAYQSVPVNAQIGVGTVVNITVSRGINAADATVPSVAGLTYSSAAELIRQSGLVIGQITYKEVEQLLPETVISQSLEANTIVRRGSKIDLELSTLPQTQP